LIVFTQKEQLMPPILMRSVACRCPAVSGRSAARIIRVQAGSKPALGMRSRICASLTRSASKRRTSSRRWSASARITPSARCSAVRSLFSQHRSASAR